MIVLRDIRRRAGRVGSLLLILGLAGYFSYHMIEGNHGILAWRRLDQELIQAQEKRAALQETQADLDRHVKQLGQEGLSLDLLEERARKVLGFTRPQEIVIVRQSPDEIQKEGL